MKKYQERLQTFAGAMMVPIILFVLVGFYVGIGSAFTNYILPRGTLFHTFFRLISSLGFMFMNNLPVWFAGGLSFALAKKEKGWGAFSGLVFYFCVLTVIQTYAGVQGWTEKTTAVDVLTANGWDAARAANFNALWGHAQGIFGYNMGIFSGIISGLIASIIHNKWVDQELPAMFAFFGGTRFVVILITLFSLPVGVALYYIWPLIGQGIQGIAHFIGRSGLLGTFVFGTLDKLLLPFGIHHLIAFPIEYSNVGGSMWIDGTLYEGVRNIMNGQAASAGATGYLVRNFTSGRLLFQLAGLPGAALAIWHTAKPENRKKVASILIPAVLTLALVGISEPIEYTFLFVAPALYFLLYAPLAGLCYVATEMAQISINGHALFFMIPNLFQMHKVHALHLLWLLPLTFAIYYFLFKIAILKFNLKTPGRGELEDPVKLTSKKEYHEQKAQKETGGVLLAQNTGDSLEERIIEALGGKDNIESITSCATRLRVGVKEEAKVASDELWMKHLEALGVVRHHSAIQIIYGVRVGGILSRINDLLER
ncbi:PTS system, maltose and glucose-specific IIC component [Clostridiaceae bacterium JG1575]|nr:PTS system, maltose and glucose-specific IIC component [Clostridiaceae bacterium JG1575]